MVAFEKFIGAFFVFTVVCIAGLGMILDINTNYRGSVNISTERFSNTYNKTQELYSFSNQTVALIKGESVDEDNTENSLFKAAFSVVKLIFTSITAPFTIMMDIAAEIFLQLPIDPRFYILLVGAVAVTLVFTIIYVIHRFQPR